MKHLAAYLLLGLAGKTPTAKEIKKLLETVGIEADNDRLNKLIEELDGKNIDELIAEGASKLASVPSGGAAVSGAGAGAAGSGGGGGGAAPEAAEEKKEEKEDDESDEDMMGGMGLFD